MLIDIRSDTVTKPSPGMLEAMMQAEVGDDVFNEDPTVKALEQKAAGILGMEAGLYCPSGTMTNQIAIRLLTRPQDELICHELSHIYLYEAGGIASNSLVSVKLVKSDRGLLTAEDIVENISEEDVHHPYTTLVSLENTMNKGGGSIYSLERIREIHTVCRDHNLSLHMDGARLFNALVETGEDPAEYGKYFDTISICLSKGLGAPVGSVLLGSGELMERGKKIRKSFGGGMRQAGYIAAAGIYALDNNIKRLAEDHRRARILEQTLKGKPYVDHILPVETNIVIFKLKDGISTASFLNKLREHDIKAGAFSKTDIRFVTHLDFTDEMLEKAVEVLEKTGKEPV